MFAIAHTAHVLWRIFGQLVDLSDINMKKLLRRVRFSVSVSALLTLVVGLLLTAVTFIAVRQVESTRQQTQFDQSARLRATAIKTDLHDAVEQLVVLNQLFRTFGVISREQFHAFTTPILHRYPEIQALSYQRVLNNADRHGFEMEMRKRIPDFQITEVVDGQQRPASVRDRYNVIDYIEPVIGNESALGLDTAYTDDRTNARQRSRDTGTAVSTGLLSLVQVNGKNTGFLVLAPVYWRGAPLDTVAARERAVIGEISAVFRVDGLIDTILRSSGFVPSPGMTIGISADNQSDQEHLAFHEGEKLAAENVLHGATGWLFYDSAPLLEESFPLAGNNWHIRVEQTAVPFIVHNHGALYVLLGGLLSSLIASGYVYILVMRIVTIEKNSKEYTASLQFANLRLSEDLTLLSAVKHYEAEIEYHAHHDILTGLANRNLLRERLTQAIATATQSGNPLWVVFIDLDRFKFVNDTLGHEAGDVLLKALAARLQSATQACDTVARLGGDEFVLVLPDQIDDAPGLAVLQRIMESIAQPLMLQDHEFFLTCSMGIAKYPGDGNSAESLIKQADIAMYRAKDMGRNTFQFYAANMIERTLERLSIEADLRHALERDEFVLHYQPQINLSNGRIVGMEVLLRWEHPIYGSIQPDRFIGLAEEMGLIIPIGAWVIRTACIQTRAWQLAGYTDLRVAVNLSARQFTQKGLAQSIADVLQASELDAHCLELELTESMIMNDVDSAVTILETLKQLGVKIAVDDFGTGYSSLSYLRRFPIDVLKIDQSFVSDLTDDADAAAIVVAIISLAHSLRLSVVAEGVETVEQLWFLRANGCDQMQGYYFSRPVTAGKFEILLQQGYGVPVIG